MAWMTQGSYLGSVKRFFWTSR